MCRILEPANPEPALVQPPAPVVSQPASPPRPAAAAPAPAAPTTPTGSLTDIAAESAVTPPRYRKHKSAIAAFREAGGGVFIENWNQTFYISPLSGIQEVKMT